MDDFYVVPLATVITGVTCSCIPHSLSFHSKVLGISIIINDDAHLPSTFLVFEFPHGTSESFLVITFVHPSILLPPTDVPLREIHCELILIYSENK